MGGALWYGWDSYDKVSCCPWDPLLNWVQMCRLILHVVTDSYTHQVLCSPKNLISCSTWSVTTISYSSAGNRIVGLPAPILGVLTRDVIKQSCHLNIEFACSSSPLHPLQLDSLDCCKQSLLRVVRFCFVIVSTHHDVFFQDFFFCQEWCRTW